MSISLRGQLAPKGLDFSASDFVLVINMQLY